MTDGPSCGHAKTISGRREPQVCNLDAGHTGPHGIRQMAGLPPYVRWTNAKDG